MGTSDDELVLDAQDVAIHYGGVKAVVTGDGKLKELYINGENLNTAVKVINEAITKAQKYAAEEMKDSMGDLSKVLGNMPKGV
jgi:DNA-binding protein YbaB